MFERLQVRAFTSVVLVWVVLVAGVIAGGVTPAEARISPVAAVTTIAAAPGGVVGQVESLALARAGARQAQSAGLVGIAPIGLSLIHI